MVKGRRMFGKLSKWITTSFGGSSSSAEQPRQPRPHRDSFSDDRRATIDPSTLCCPICYRIYPSTPRSLRCGHSLCEICLTGIVKETTTISGQPHLHITRHRQVECPICRDTHRLAVGERAAQRNFALESVLESVAEVLTDGECPTPDVNLALQNERLTAQLTEMKKTVTRQEAEQKAMLREVTQWKMFALVMGVFLLWRWIRGW